MDQSKSPNQSSEVKPTVGKSSHLALKVIAPIAICILIGGVYAFCKDKKEPVPTVDNPKLYQDWPHWTGPTLSNISQETGWVSDWPKDGPPILWEQEVGKGYSSFSIVKGRVFTMGHTDGKETVYCMNVDSGKPIWKHTYPCKLINNLHKGGPAATPTVDDGRVYTVSKEGQMFCLDYDDGKVIWQADFKKLFGAKTPAWGFSSSPFVYDDMVIVDGGRIAAFEKNTGKVIWKTKLYKPGYGSATLFENDGTKYITVLNNEFLLLLNPANGRVVAKEKWLTSFKTNSTTPLVSDDTIFISTGYGKGCGLFKVEDRKLSSVYKNKKMANHFNNSVLHEGHLYGFHGNSHNSKNIKLVCMDYKTGKVKWDHRGLGCGSLIIADKKLVVLSDKGKLLIVEATPKEFTTIAEADVISGGRCWTAPVLSHGRVFCRNENGNVVCVDVRPPKK